MSGLLLIFISAFLAATILPVGSEPVLLAYWVSQPEASVAWSVVVAGLGNTLGGGLTYAMGRGLRQAWQVWRNRSAAHLPQHDVPNDIIHHASDKTSNRKSSKSNDKLICVRLVDNHSVATNEPSGRALRWLNHYGPVALLLSWLPVVGDPLCLAAGTLRLRVLPCLFFMSIGKFGRYATLAWLFWVWSKP